MRYFASLILGALLVAVPAITAAGQDRVAGAQRLDRRLLHLTFGENFMHFEASDTGRMRGRPVWQTTFNGGLRTLQNNHEAEWYGNIGPDGPFRINDGTLDITAMPVSGLPAGLTDVSGLITSQQLFSQTYGYFEICAQLPRGRGWWPAFWLLPSDGTWPPEIDAMEMLGDSTTQYYVSVHAVTGQQRLDDVTKLGASDLTKGFHVFGVSWRPDHIRYYLDGTLVHNIATPAGMDRPMYLLANLAVGAAGSWPGAVVPNATGVYRIAWIRAWQFNDLGKVK